jgi:ferredoxin--NADP+ reductase
VIGTNKSDAADVVDLLISELKEPKDSNGITDLLKSGHEVIDQEGWEKINASEILSGAKLGKNRLKETIIKRMIEISKNN